MLTLPVEGLRTILPFRPVFSKRTFALISVLLSGGLLASGPRTICAVLRLCGLGSDRTFHKYHRFLGRAKWSSLNASRILLNLLIVAFCKVDGPLVFGIDETIGRRRGAKINAKGIYRDPVRPSHPHFVKCSGLRWVCLMLLSAINWAGKVWALPFLTALAPSGHYCKARNKKHKKITDWARQMIRVLGRWLPGRKVIVVADSSYSALELLNTVKDKATLITRLRPDAALYEPAPERKAGQIGRKRLKGKRLSTLKEQLTSPALCWQSVIVPQWYGQKNKRMELGSGTAVWYHSGMEPVPVRRVLPRDMKGKGEPAALLGTDLTLDGLTIVNYFIRRWALEVTFREVRTHLGVEGQRQWPDQAIARTTPLLLSLFSITALWADELNRQGKLLVQKTAWYQKQQPTFSDALAAVRRQLWAHHPFCISDESHPTTQISVRWIAFLTETLARAA